MAAAGPESLPLGASGAERRQLTVLFAGLVGSTALAHQLDPEDGGENCKGSNQPDLRSISSAFTGRPTTPSIANTTETNGPISKNFELHHSMSGTLQVLPPNHDFMPPGFQPRC